LKGRGARAQESRTGSDHHTAKVYGPATAKDFQSTVAKLLKDFQLPAAQEQKEIQVLTASLKQQAAQIQKVTRLRRVEVSKSVP